jgi:peptide/nickel transport system substrate-binding protein
MPATQPDRSSTPALRGYPGRRQFLAGLAAATVTAGAGGALAACGSRPAAGPAGPQPRKRYGGNLIAGLTGGSASDTLDPHQGLTYLDTARASALYEPLVHLSADARLQYVLAEDITPRGGRLDQWVIRLRPGITFHDGRPLTAADVIYTLRRIIANRYSAVNVLGPVDAAGIRSLDPRTVLVPMSRPYASLPEQLAGILTAQIIPAGFDPARHKPNGTGPFRYTSFTPGQRSVFARNPHYWQHGLPYADTLTIIDFPDTVSLADALITGQVHAAGTLDGPQMATLANTSGITPVASPAGTIIPFTMRVDQPPFNDVRVRQAMRLLADRQQLIDSALDGYGRPASDVFSPYDPDFDHALHREADIPQAKFLLRQAGRENLTVTLVTSPIATGTVAMATVLAQQARAAGVTIKVQQVPPGTFFGPDYLKWGFAQDFYSYAPYLAQVTLSMLPTSPWDETHFHDPAYIQLYARANATTSDGLRAQIVRDMQLTDFDHGGYLIPAFIDTLDAYRREITGYAPSRLGQPLDDYAFARLAFTA